MARAKVNGIPDPKPTPETMAYALVPGPSGTVLRTYALRGTEVLAYDDTAPDTKGSALFQLMRILTRD
jgi:hypothetical protein